MQNIDLSSLIQVKLDFSLVQDSLTLAIKDILARVTNLETSHNKITESNHKLQKETHKLYQLIEQSKQANGHSLKILQDKINWLRHSLSAQLKPHQQSLQFPHISNEAYEQSVKGGQVRLQAGRDEEKKVNVSQGSNTQDKIYQNYRVKEQDPSKGQKVRYEKNLHDVYAKSIQKIEAEIEQLKKDLRSQINQFANKSMKFIDGRLTEYKNSIPHHEKEERNHKNGGDQKVKSQWEKNESGTTQRTSTAINTLNPSNKSQKVVVISTKVVQSTSFKVQPKSLKNLQNPPESNQVAPEMKQQIKEFIDELKRQLKSEMEQIVKSAEHKFEQINRTNSVLADHLVEAKKTVEDIINDKDALKIQMAGIREKSLGSEKQLNVLIDTTNEYKNKFKAIEYSLSRLTEELKEYKSGQEVIKEQANEDEYQNTSRNDIFRDSHTSFRSSANNLGPIRHNSVMKANNNKIEAIEQSMKSMTNRLNSLVDRFNRMEEQKKKWQGQQINGMLPKIDKQNKSNVNPLEIIKQELKKVNNDILKTNEKLTSTKDKLNQLYESHAEIPSKIQDLYKKLREHSQLQEDRLIELIKELINRMLSDPFDNHFTNRLKREINVKFLEIKYEYNSILKQIESKVENRAQKVEVEKLTHQYEESILELKSIANKKCQTQDFKKGVKYLENKIKEVFQFARTQTVALANQQKQYIGAKKQSLH